MTVQIWTFLKYENNVIHRQFHPKIGPNLGIFMTELNTPLHCFTFYLRDHLLD